MNPKLTRLLQLMGTYLPLAGTAVVLVISTFDSSLLDEIPASLLLAIMAVSFVFVAVHLEQRLSALQTSVNRLDSGLTSSVADLKQALSDRISALETTHRSYLEATTPDLRTSSLAEAFDRAVRGRDRIGHLRVYAISSQQVFSFVSNSNLTVDRCSLLIQGFPPDCESDFARHVRLIAREWRRLAGSGRIRELKIRSYDYLPTDYEVLFDSDALILGLFDYAPEDDSKVRLRAANLIDGTSPAAHSLVVEFRDRFDGLFAACETDHGPNLYAEI